MDTDKAKKILVQQMDRHRKIQKYASEFGNHLMAAEHRELPTQSKRRWRR